jgi:hypothetical protein
MGFESREQRAIVASLDEESTSAGGESHRARRCNLTFGCRLLSLIAVVLMLAGSEGRPAYCGKFDLGMRNHGEERWHQRASVALC